MFPLVQSYLHYQQQEIDYMFIEAIESNYASTLCAKFKVPRCCDAVIEK